MHTSITPPWTRYDLITLLLVGNLLGRASFSKEHTLWCLTALFMEVIVSLLKSASPKHCVSIWRTVSRHHCESSLLCMPSHREARALISLHGSCWTVLSHALTGSGLFHHNRPSYTTPRVPPESYATHRGRDTHHGSWSAFPHPEICLITEQGSLDTPAALAWHMILGSLAIGSWLQTIPQGRMREASSHRCARWLAGSFTD